MSNAEALEIYSKIANVEDGKPLAMVCCICKDRTSLVEPVPIIEGPWRGRWFPKTAHDSCIDREQKFQTQKELLENSGLVYPGDKTFEGFDTYNKSLQVALIRTMKFADELIKQNGQPKKHIVFGPWLIGSNGRGKSHLMEALIYYLVCHGIRARYLSVAQLLFDLQASFGNDEQGMLQSETFWSNTTARVLAMDNLGIGKASEWAKSVLFNMLEFRVVAKRPTAIAMDESPGEIGKQWHERIPSRAFRLCGKPIIVTGSDYGLRNKER